MTARDPSTLRRLAAVIGCVGVAIAGTVLSLYRVQPTAPYVQARALDVGAASTRVAIDLPRPLAANADATDADFQDLYKRSVLLGQLMTSKPALERIARKAGVDPADVAGTTKVSQNVQTALVEPDSERRAGQIVAARRPIQLEVAPSQYRPILEIHVQAPSVAQAQRVADAAVPGMRRWLADEARGTGRPPAGYRIVQLGPARGAIVNGHAKIEIAAMTFLFSLLAAATALAGVRRLRRGPRRGDDTAAAAVAERRVAPAAPAADARARWQSRLSLGMLAGPQPALGGAGGTLGSGGVSTAVRRPEPSPRPAARVAAGHLGDWPRTTRILPWSVAAIMVLVWLVPFNVIQLDVALPVDLKLDRLLLAVIVPLWLLILAAGGRDAPRLRLTPVHVAVGAVVGVAWLSIVLQSEALNQSLEFETALKKLTLLASYATVFVIVASVVRRSEIRAFMTFTLGLALICAVGVIVEYRFEYNVFSSVFSAILPGIFKTDLQTSGGLDEIGRRMILGPAQVALETVAMLAMALPIALVRLLEAERTRERILYGLATALLFAAMVSTFRKTAFVVPLAVCVTLVVFRGREMLRLAPMALVLVVLVPLVTPGALASVADQLHGSRLGVTTVSDRTSDYDAIRPDVWSHLLLGGGYGSYEHTTRRVLDNELLGQAVEVGFLGVLAFIMLGVTIIAVARGPIRARGPGASVGLVAAACATGFLVVSVLFDVMSFPHVPYLFLCAAALLAVQVSDDGGREPRRSWNS